MSNWFISLVYPPYKLCALPMEFVGNPSTSLAPLPSLSHIRARCFFTLVVSSGMCRGWGFSVWSFDDLARVVLSRCVTAASTDSCQPCVHRKPVPLCVKLFTCVETQWQQLLITHVSNMLTSFDDIFFLSR